MDNQRKVKISKYLSKHLRHSPEAIGLKPDKAGWVAVDDLFEACKKANFIFSGEELEEVVSTNDKQRFSFSEDRKKIRANQGHSIKVELGYETSNPPEFLYHGTASQNTESILKNGLQKMQRHHVHLSRDIETAIKVGKRHGPPVIFKVFSGKMYESGYKFYCSENGVWLTDKVPPQFMELQEK